MNYPEVVLRLINDKRVEGYRKRIKELEKIIVDNLVYARCCDEYYYKTTFIHFSNCQDCNALICMVCQEICICNKYFCNDCVVKCDDCHSVICYKCNNDDTFCKKITDCEGCPDYATTCSLCWTECSMCNRKMCEKCHFKNDMCRRCSKN